MMESDTAFLGIPEVVPKVETVQVEEVPDVDKFDMIHLGGSDIMVPVCAKLVGELFSLRFKDYLSAFKAFTLTPNPLRYTSLDPSEQYLSLLQCLLLNPQIKHTFQEFLFTPELTEEGNIHIHGYYSIKDSIKYNNWFLPACKSLGFIKVKPRVDEGWTKKYVCKDMNRMEDILSHHCPIPLTSENWQHNYDKYKDKLKRHFKINFTKKPKYKSVLRYFVKPRV